MSARSKARKRALDVLFEAEQRSAPVLETLAGRLAAADPPVSEYAVELVEGVVAHQKRIDELLATYSRDWPLDRMPAVDRALLRLATFELLWCDDVPDAVVIDEAVTLARSLSTDESPAFVNGLLGRLLDLKPELTAEPSQRARRAGRARPRPAAGVRTAGRDPWTEVNAPGPRRIRRGPGASITLRGHSREGRRRWAPGSVEGAAGLGVEDAPGDELLGELRGGLVVDDRQRAQVLLADREHPAVVVAALGLDGRRVAGQRAGLLGRDDLQLLQVDDQPRRRLGRAERACCPAAARRPGRRRSRPARPAAARSRRGRRARRSRPRRPSTGRRTSPRPRAKRGPAGCGSPAGGSLEHVRTRSASGAAPSPRSPARDLIRPTPPDEADNRLSR